MRTSNHLDGKSVATMTSPFYRYDHISCIQFYYRMKATKKDAWTALTLSLRNDQGSTQAVWRYCSDVQSQLSQISVSK